MTFPELTDEFSLNLCLRCISVIRSCVTSEQLMVARKYTILAVRQMHGRHVETLSDALRKRHEAVRLRQAYIAATAKEK